MNILEEADILVNGDRQADYSHPADDFTRQAKIWSGILSAKLICDITPEEVGLCMIGVKIARESHRHKIDNLIDAAGYAQCVQLVHDRREAEADLEPPPRFADLEPPPRFNVGSNS